VVDNPKGDYYGGSVAAPAFGNIAAAALPYLGVPADPNAKPDPSVLAP
jgi:cell division protein FtsI (penicillin-binding protein 3)